MSSLTYKDAGVNIDAGNLLVEKIKPFTRATARPGADGGIGSFSGVIDLAATGYKDPLLLAATDGVGTKLKLAIETGIHSHIGIDLVAMCVNDILVSGGEPLFFLDYYACGQLDVNVAASVVKSIAEGCQQAGAALIGGETAEMPGMYGAKDYDLAGFAVGAVERDKLIQPDWVNAGDVLIGLASSGVHANGFSLVRKILAQEGEGLKQILAKPAPFDLPKGAVGPTLGEVLLTPTRIYVKSLLPLAQKGKLSALCHITGGGFYDNLPRILPDGLACDIHLSSWGMPPLFSWLQQKGNVSAYEMLRSFNCGIGMVIAVKPDDKDQIMADLQAAGEQAYEIGHITKKPKADADHVVIYDQGQKIPISAS